MNIMPTERANTGTGATVDWSHYPPTLSSSQFSSSQNAWTQIKLKGDVLNKARLTSRHLCLEVQGGPTQGACIVSSELTRQAPVLEIWMREGATKVTYGEGDVTKDKRAKVADKVSSQAAKEMDDHERKLREKFTAKFTKEILATKAKSAKKSIQKIKQASSDKRATTQANAAMKIKNAVSGLTSQKIQAKGEEIAKAERAKVAAQIKKSRLKGVQLHIFRKKLDAKAKIDIAEKTKAAIQMMEAKATNKSNKQQVQVQVAQEKEKLREKKQEAEAAKRALELAPRQKDEVKRKTDAAVKVSMANYMQRKANGGRLVKRARKTTKTTNTANTTKVTNRHRTYEVATLELDY